MRKKEPWMTKGARVLLTGDRKGTLTSFHESNLSDGTYIHSVNVQTDGVKRSFPVSADDIEPLKEKR